MFLVIGDKVRHNFFLNNYHEIQSKYSMRKYKASERSSVLKEFFDQNMFTIFAATIFFNASR